MRSRIAFLLLYLQLAACSPSVDGPMGSADLSHSGLMPVGQEQSPCSPPVFSPEGDVFESSVMVRLSSPDCPGAEIYYQIRDSFLVKLDEFVLYTQPITLSNTAYINAFVQRIGEDALVPIDGTIHSLRSQHYVITVPDNTDHEPIDDPAADPVDDPGDDMNDDQNGDPTDDPVNDPVTGDELDLVFDVTPAIVTNVDIRALAQASADVNSDGLDDIVSIGRRDGATGFVHDLVVHLSNGDGTFLSSAGVSLGLGVYEGLHVWDLDNDGDLDVSTVQVASYDSYTPHLTVIKNDGTGRYGTPIDTLIPLDDVEVWWLHGADGANTPDVEVLGPHQRVLLENDGQGLFTAGPAVDLPDGFSAYSGVHFPIGDVDGNGHDDLAEYIEESVDGIPRFYILRLDPGAFVGYQSSGTFTVASSVVNVLAADLNGDGSRDVVLQCRFGVPLYDEGPTLFLFLGDGNGGFSVEKLDVLHEQPYQESLLVGDFIGDAAMDLFVNTTLIENTGLAFKVRPLSHVSVDIRSPYLAGDFDGDGDTDLMALLDANPLEKMFTFDLAHIYWNRKTD